MDLFRVPVIALVIGWILGAVFTKILIPFLEKKQFRQFVREVGPQSHLSKTGTPSMGGIAIVSATIIASLTGGVLAGGISWFKLIVTLVVMVLFGLIGFIDDYEKAIKKNNAGISPKTENHSAVCVFRRVCGLCIYEIRIRRCEWKQRVDPFCRCIFGSGNFLYSFRHLCHDCIQQCSEFDGRTGWIGFRSYSVGCFLHGDPGSECFPDAFGRTDCVWCTGRRLSGILDLQ